MLDMLHQLLRWLWLKLPAVLDFSRPTVASSQQHAGWNPDRLLHNTEKYWLFTPLQRVYCLTATLEPVLHARLTKEQLADAILRVAQTRGFFNLVCALSAPHSETAARWMAPTDLNVVRQLIQRSITVVGDSAVEAVIERELAADFDVSDCGVALWRLLLLPASGSLVWTFQHILGDGIAARDSMQLLVQHLTDDASDERQQAFTPSPMTSALETLLPPRLTVSSWVVAIRKLLSSKPKPFLGRTADELPRSALSSRVHIEQLSSEQTTKARAKAKSRGVTMHGLMVAASASAMRRVFQPGATPCSFVTPINLRPYMPRDSPHSVGNCITSHRDFHLCSSATTEQDDFDFARRYMASLQQSVLQSYRTQTALMWLGARLGLASTLAGDVAKLHSLRKDTVEVSNLGALDSVPQCAALSFSSRAHNDAPLLILGPISCNGRLNLSLSYCAPLVSREEAQRYVADMVAIMTE